LNAVLVNADEATGRATSIERVSLSAQQIETLVAQPTAARSS
jgi:calcineurin-like phosphoesterase